MVSKLWSIIVHCLETPNSYAGAHFYFTFAGHFFPAGEGRSYFSNPLYSGVTKDFAKVKFTKHFSHLYSVWTDFVEFFWAMKAF